MQQGGNSEEFLESVKVDLFPDKVYVFTPKGEILRLPRGATCVDFAYAVHTDVGNRCVAAKIDRRLVPLRTPLRNGQTVEIITAKGATPNPSWVNFVVTAKARAAIRHYLKNLKRAEAIELGRRLLNQALRGVLAQPAQGAGEASTRRWCATSACATTDELFEKIGLGERLAPLVARRLAAATTRARRANGGAPASARDRRHRGPGRQLRALLLPDPGRPDHRATCRAAAASSSTARPAATSPSTASSRRSGSRSPGSRPSTACSTSRSASTSPTASACWRASPRPSPARRPTSTTCRSMERDGDTSTLVFELQVHDRRNLARVIRAVRRMPEVLKVTRTLA